MATGFPIPKNYLARDRGRPRPAIDRLFLQHERAVYTVPEARRAGLTFAEILEILGLAGLEDADVARLVRLFVADEAALVVDIIASPIAHGAACSAIRQARRYARGQTKSAAMRQLADLADDKELYVESVAEERAFKAAFAAAFVPPHRLDMGTASFEALYLAREARRPRNNHARDLLLADQFGRLVSRFADPEPADVPLPDQTSRPCQRPAAAGASR